MGVHQRRQPGRDRLVPAQLKAELGPLLTRVEVPAGQPGNGLVQHRRVDVLKRLAAPQPDRPGQGRRGALGRSGLAGRRDQLLEAQQI